MTVRSRGGISIARPLSSLAAPVPPASATTDMSIATGFAQRPERAAAAPGVETGAVPAREVGGQRALRHRDEAEAHPDAVEALGTREERHDASGGSLVGHGGGQLRGDLAGLG